MNRKRLAQIFWILWALVVWHVVFDRVIVSAGRRYIAAAYLAASAAYSSSYAAMDEWMAPAVTRGLWTATGASAAILLVGFLAIRIATRRERSRPGTPSADPSKLV